MTFNCFSSQHSTNFDPFRLSSICFNVLETTSALAPLLGIDNVMTMCYNILKGVIMLTDKTTIQIRTTAELKEKLKNRAKEQGLSLSAYIKMLLTKQLK